MLSQLLWDTGIAGRPPHHFYHNIGPENPSGDIVFVYRGFLQQAPKRGSTANGVFGSKIGGGYWHDFVRRLRAIDGMRALPLNVVLDGFFHNLHYIHLTRRNKVRQAVSH